MRKWILVLPDSFFLVRIITWSFRFCADDSILAYFFSQNASATSTTVATIAGPVDTTYTKTDAVEQATLVWSPCGTSGIVSQIP